MLITKHLFHFLIPICVCASACVNNNSACANNNTTRLKYQQNVFSAPTIKTIPVAIDEGFSSTDKLEIKRAIGEWNYSLNGNIIIKIDSENFDMGIEEIDNILKNDGFLILKTDMDNPTAQNIEDADHPTLGFTELNGKTKIIYVLSDRVKTNRIFAIILHEIGHILGVGHISNSLMAGEYSKDAYRCIDIETAKEIAEVNHFKVSTMNYCTR